MFDSADVSPPRVLTKEPRLSANLRRPGQFACLTLHNHLQSCTQKTSVLLKHAKRSAKLCILKLQSAFMAGGSLSSDGAVTTQAGSIIINQRIWICCFAHLLKLTCCKTERRSEERRRKRGEGRKYSSGTISDLWNVWNQNTDMPILYAKSIHVKTKEGERER